jgi:ATP-dependent DNA helicase 2 subunit 1
VLLPGTIGADDDEDEGTMPSQLSITRIDDLLAQMRFHEAPKRALFSIPLTLAKGLVIGVKGSAVLLHLLEGQGVMTREQVRIGHGAEERRV